MKNLMCRIARNLAWVWFGLLMAWQMWAWVPLVLFVAIIADLLVED